MEEFRFKAHICWLPSLGTSRGASVLKLLVQNQLLQDLLKHRLQSPTSRFPDSAALWEGQEFVLLTSSCWCSYCWSRGCSGRTTAVQSRTCMQNRWSVREGIGPNDCRSTKVSDSGIVFKSLENTPCTYIAFHIYDLTCSFQYPWAVIIISMQCELFLEVYG